MLSFRKQQQQRPSGLLSSSSTSTTTSRNVVGDNKNHGRGGASILVIVVVVVVTLLLFVTVYGGILPLDSSSLTILNQDLIYLRSASNNQDKALLQGTTTTTSLQTPAPVPKLDEPLNVLVARHKKALRYFGTKATNTGWYVDTLCLKHQQQSQQNDNKPLLVYGVGAGEDISWDTSLVDTYGATVHVFDPTEKSIRYLQPILTKYAHTHKLFHTAEGLAAQAGTLSFALPANPDHVSMRHAAMADANMVRTVSVPVNTLQAWMQQRQHDYLDILKIDIEGSEYDVLEALMAQNYMPFTQLLVEYHDRFLDAAERHRHANVRRALLQDAGFVELWSQNGGQEVGYIKAADLPYCADNGTSPRRPGITPLSALESK